jgi:hypothetical protein
MTWVRRKRVAGHVYLCTVKSVRSGSQVRQVIVRWLGPASPIYETGRQAARPPEGRKRPPQRSTSGVRPAAIHRRFNEHEITGPGGFSKPEKVFDGPGKSVTHETGRPYFGLPKRTGGSRGRPKKELSLEEHAKNVRAKKLRRARNRRYYLARREAAK